jgi:hypothetical protein
MEHDQEIHVGTHGRVIRTQFRLAEVDRGPFKYEFGSVEIRWYRNDTQVPFDAPKVTVSHRGGSLETARRMAAAIEALCERAEQIIAAGSTPSHD